jgi:dTDP-3-amino-3,4,6-trideoxy-alpha-D-glucose transaminase
LQAAFLRVKLAALPAWNARRNVIAARYLAELKNLPGLVLPQVAEGADPVWHLFVVRHPRRDWLQQQLTDRGIGTAIHYPVPPHLAGAYARPDGPGRGAFPVAELCSDTLLSLPIGPHMSGDQVSRVIESVQMCVRLA